MKCLSSVHNEEPHLTDAKLGSAVKTGEARSEYTWKWAPQECHLEMKPSEAGIQVAKHGSASELFF